jgi:hypothetical protein
VQHGPAWLKGHGGGGGEGGVDPAKACGSGADVCRLGTCSTWSGAVTQQHLTHSLCIQERQQRPHWAQGGDSLSFCVLQGELVCVRVIE